MAEIVAYVKNIKNTVYAVDSKGNKRVLHEGDAIYRGEYIATGDDGHVDLFMGQERPVGIPEHRVVAVEESIVKPDTVAADEGRIAGDESLEAIIKAVQGGLDPTQLLAATAAGGASGEGHSFVRLLRIVEQLNTDTDQNNENSSFAPLAIETGAENFVENQAPIVSDGAVTTNEDQQISGVINAIDPNGDPLTYTVATNATNGVVVINADGTYTYTPNTNFNGSDSFVVAVSDGNGGVQNVTINVDISAVNDDPIAVNDSITTIEDQPVTINVLANDSDVENDVITITSATAAHGTVTINSDGTVTYTPNAQYNGADVITYTISDGHGGTSTATINVGVTALNDAPTIDVIARAITEEAVSTATVVATFTAADVDGDVLTYSLLNDPNGYFQIVGNEVHLTAAGVAAVNSDQLNLQNLSVTVQASDGTLTASDTDISTITRVNDNSPTIDVVANPITEEAVSTATVVATFSASDVDGDTLTYALLNNGNGYFVLSGNQVFLTAAGVAAVNDDTLNLQNLTITVQVSDGVHTAQDSDTTIITRVDDNAPVTSPVTLSAIAEDSGARVITQAELLANASDIDGGTLVASGLTIASGNGSLVDNGDGTWTYTPASNDDTQVSFSYTISDGAASVAGAASLDITPVNDAPVGTDFNVTLNEDDSTTFSFSQFGFSDVDVGDTFGGVRIDSLPTNGTIYLNGSAIGAGTFVTAAQINSGQLTFVPTSNTDADASFTFSVRDSSGGFDATPNTATINITAVADQPILSLGSITPTPSTNTAAGFGLRLNYFDAVDIAGAGNSEQFAANLEGIFNTMTPTTSQVVSVVDLYTEGASGNDQHEVGDKDGVSVTGLIYLQAGQTYTFGGYHDDTVRFEIGGNVLASLNFDSWGNHSWTFTPTQSGYYSLELFLANNNGAGALSLNVSVNGGAAQALSTLPIFTDVSVINAANLQHEPFVANGGGGFYPAQYNQGDEDTAIRLQAINASLVDTDGSESLAVNISNIPVGATLTDGVNTFTATAGNTTVNIATWTTTNLSVTPPANYNGTITLTVTATATESSNGSSSSSTQTINVVVNPVNDAPILDLDTSGAGNNFTTAYTENAVGVSIADTDIALSDVDSSNITSATITLTNAQLGDLLSAGTMPAGITASIVGNVVTLSGSASLASYQTAIRAITFSSSSENPSTVQRDITVVVNDGSANSNTAHTYINVTSVNDAPVLDLDSGNAGSNFTTSYTENAAAISIAASTISISDVDSNNITSATITLTNAQAGDVLSAGSLPAGITASIVGNVVTLSGSASLANYQTAISAITFSSTSENPSTVQRDITIVVNDGNANSNTAHTFINVTAVNDVPVAQNSAVTLNEDTTHTFALNQFNYTDAEGNATSSITIASLPTQGVLRLNGIAVTNGQVIAASEITAGHLTFTPFSNDNGNNYANFQFRVNDSGNGTTAATMTLNVTPVNDGAPNAQNDNFITTVGTPITITTAQLLGNDSLPDHAHITNVSTASGGNLVNNGNGTWTYTPPAGGPSNNTFTYTITDDDNQTSSATVRIIAVNGRDDLATVQESALSSGSGGGSYIATGNVLSNDGGAGSVTSITYGGNTYTPSGGVITVTTPYGVLQVTAATGAYTYTLQHSVDNDSAVGATSTSFSDDFTYVTNTGTSAALHVSIQDDAPTATSHTVNITESTLPRFNVTLIVDVSGSMSDLVKWVDSNGVVHEQSRLQMAQQALVDLVKEYFSQTNNVSINLVSFNGSASAENTYTSLTSAMTAISNLTPGGGTNYQAALDTARTSAATNVAGAQNIVYFLSDGAPSTDPTTAINNFNSFSTANGIQSYAIAMGSGISNLTYLNNIHNVDGDLSGTKDLAIVVPDLSDLASQLLATVPGNVGGTVLSTGGVNYVELGADGGRIQQMTIMMDRNGDGIPETNVTFTYNGTQITNNGGLPTITGSTLTIAAAQGFTHGTLNFNFANGQYTYFTGGVAQEGDQFNFSFTAIDNDGDVSNSATLTLNIIDGAPIAYADTDTLFARTTFLEGNVIRGMGTDGGVALGEQFTSFSSQGSGVDHIVDGARISSINFHGQNINLLAANTGSGSGFTWSVSASGVLTVTGSGALAGLTLTMNRDGYYRYTPATTDLPTPSVGTANTVSLTSSPSSASGIVIGGTSRTGATETSANVTYASGNGVGVVGGANNNTLDRLESITINFSRAQHPNGVQNVSFVARDLSTSEKLIVTVYHIDGHVLGQFVATGSGLTNTTITIPSNFSAVGSIEVQAIDSTGTTGSYTSTVLSSITYSDVLTNTTATGVAPEVIGYTLTDTDGDTSSSTLTLNMITNNMAGTNADDTTLTTGTQANDYISGLGGNDTINAGAGHDIVEGGDGNDTITAGTGNDRVDGGSGNDVITGDDGDDVIRGEAGNDTISGGIGIDSIDGGIGVDNLSGGAGNDVIRGGADNDILSGGSGSDVFAWSLDDAGTGLAPATDTISDFTAGAGGDVLDLRDLLSGEESGQIESYLHFSSDGAGGTRIEVWTDGDHSHAANQIIVLQGTDLLALYGNNDSAIIQTLLNNGQLKIDDNP